MATLTYIIPIHKFDTKVDTLLTRALTSIKNCEEQDYFVLLVGPKAVLENTEKTIKKVGLDECVKYVENEDTTFQAQINAAVFRCTTKYFSIVEFDDEVTPYWSRVAKKYGENGASLLLPIIEYRSAEVPVSLGNELAWDTSFADENNLGYINNEMLNTYMDFFTHGALINTEDFIALGCLKPSLKIASWYEFLLRCCHKNKEIYVVPKIGYLHYIDTPDSYSEISKKEITPEEGQWLIATAKEEYFFKEDRNKKFEK